MNPFGAGHPDRVAREFEHVSNQPGRGGLAVDPRDRDDGDASVLSRREEGVEDRLADRPGLAQGRLQVHPQAGAGVDLDDHAPLLFERARDVAGDDVHAGDVEPDHQRGLNGAGGDLGVDQVGDVGRGAAGAQVGVAADDHDVTRQRH